MATAVAAADEPSLKLQIVVDKKKNRVMFAEAKKDFVDFICHILSLPLGAVQRILTKTSTTSLGSIGTLQEGLNKLDAKYMEDLAKDYILDLKAPYWGKHPTLLLPEASRSNSRSRAFYQCSNDHTIRLEARCSHCGSCSKQISLGSNEVALTLLLGNNEKGYVKEAATFMVMDDLVVRSAEPASVISLMNQHSIKDVGDIEKREVSFGTAQAIQLLKASVSSKTVLTDVFLAGAAVKAEI